MSYTFRDLIARLRDAGELTEINKSVDIRHIATLVDQSKKTLMFNNVTGYKMPVISGVTNSRERLAIAAGCEFSKIESLLRRGLNTPIEPKYVNTGPSREVFLEGEEVDLYN